MNKYQFSALFFAISLLKPGLTPFIETAFVICATIAFLTGLKGE
jgi:hypothetical protein